MSKKYRYTLYHDIRKRNKKEHIILASVVTDYNDKRDMNLELAERFFAFEFYKALIKCMHNGEGYAFNLDIPKNLDSIEDLRDDCQDTTITTLGSVYETFMGLPPVTIHTFYIERTKEQKGTQQ